VKILFVFLGSSQISVYELLCRESRLTMSRQYDRLKCRQDKREAGILPVTAEYRAA